MKTKFLVRSGIGAAAVLLALVCVAATTAPRRPANQAFMRQKLAHSQGILEGLALEKFELVTRHAVRLRNMTHSNLWYTIRAPEYMLQTTNYQKSVDRLYMAAADKNLEDATEAYARLARNCVECHRVLRLEQRRQSVLGK